MDAFHKPKTRPWMSEVVNVQEFKDSWNNDDFGMPRGFLNGSTSSTEELVRMLKIPAYKMAEVDNSCKLMNHNEDSIEFIPGPGLSTRKFWDEDKKRRQTDNKYNMTVYNTRMLHAYARSHPIRPKGGDSMPSGHNVRMPEIVLTVQVFRPMKSKKESVADGPAKNPRYNIESVFMVLGCQNLTELCDKLTCMSDRAIPCDFSEDPFQSIPPKCKDLYKSSFFFINGVFYDDMRDANNIEYSRFIMEWAKDVEGFGPLQKKEMKTTTFVELELRLGYPYVYVHQGYCEHLIVFSDLRFLDETDCQDRNEYPIQEAGSERRKVYCMNCHIQLARWVVDKNARLPQNPYAFCESCFINFNYDSNGKKIGEFTAHHFVDTTND